MAIIRRLREDQRKVGLASGNQLVKYIENKKGIVLLKEHFVKYIKLLRKNFIRFDTKYDL